MDFGEAEARFRQLERQLRMRRITPEAYRAALNAIRVTDARGRLWMIQERTGRWHVYEDGRWMPAMPPRSGAQRLVADTLQPAIPRPEPASSSGPAQVPPEDRPPAKPWEGLLLFGGLALLALTLVCVAGVWLGRGLFARQPGSTATLGARGAVLECEGLRISFGPGALPEGAQVSARVVASAAAVAEAQRSHPGGWLVAVGPVYEVSLPQGVPLQAMVEVTLPYDPSLLGDADPQQISGALWNGEWWERRPSTVDTAQHTVTFVADHFSQVAAVYERMYETSAAFTAGHFIIHYATDGPEAPLNNSQYIAHEHVPGQETPGYVSLPNREAPAYVVDLYTYLEEAYRRIADMGYAMPPDSGLPLEVYIRDLHSPGILQSLGLVGPKQLDGATGAWGPIYIDNELRDCSGSLRDPQEVWRKLKSTAAHELFHVVQCYNPSFPTWFYEASAVYMEWRLFGNELPEVVPQDHINPRAAFLYNGLWRGTVNDHYAKAALLIYLQDRYGGCGDILKDGIYPQGGSSYGIYVAGLKSADMGEVFLKAAQKCGGFRGTWADLLAEFARCYYVEWEQWPTAEKLLSGNRSAPLVQNSLTTTGYREEAFQWKLREGGGGCHTFPKYTWRDGSAAMWRIIVTSASVPVSTLVLEADTPNEAGAPQHWAYPFHHIPDISEVRGAAVGPTRFHGDRPTLAFKEFGSRKAGGKVFEVDLVGVDDSVGLFGATSTLRAYLLPAPKAVHSEWVQVTEGGRQVQKLRVKWQDDVAWLPIGVPNLAHVVYASADPAAPLRKRLGYVLLGQGDSLDIVPPDGASVVAVVLADSYGNQGPPAVANLAALPTLAGDDAALEALKGALQRLGYGYEMWQSGMDTSGTVQQYYRSAKPAGWSYALYTVLQDTGALKQTERFTLRITTGTTAELDREFQDALKLEGSTETTYRGYPAMSLECGYSQGQTRWVASSQRYLMVRAGDVLLSVVISHDCESAYDGTSGTLPQCQPEAVEPARLQSAMDALLDEAKRLGLIAP